MYDFAQKVLCARWPVFVAENVVLRRGYGSYSDYDLAEVSFID